MNPVKKVDRRTFIRGGVGAGAGLLLGFAIPEARRLSGQEHAKDSNESARRKNSASPDAFIHIGTDDTVTFIITKPEMGQGTVTSLAMLLAEELDCDWKQVRTEFAPVDSASYGMQGVYGSSSIRTLWKPLRQTGATARAMLVTAAAQKWNVQESQVRTENGCLIGPANGQRLSYGSLAQAASQLPIPSGVPVKDPKDFRLIGKPVKRLDTRTKINGSAQFGIDARVPGMQYAVVAHAPVFGGKVLKFDATKAKEIAGVAAVIEVPGGVAVVAEDTWSAMQGRDALAIEWDEGANAGQSSAGIRQMMVNLADAKGPVAKQVGDAPAAISAAARKIDAVYEAPFLSHAPMEPINCTALVRPDGCEIWASTQAPSGARQIAAKVTGLAPESVKVNSLFMGGGFGRRSNVDYVEEAVHIAKALPGTPVKLTWTREDDMRRGPFRPASYVRFSGAVDEQGWPAAFTARIVCPSFFGDAGDGVDHMAVQGVDTLPYALPHLLVEHHKAETGVPTFFWRSVGYSQNTFYAESFLDELAAAGGKDPLQLRRRLLTGSPRMLEVLNRAAAKANWGHAPAGRFQGVALVNNVGSFTAQIAEVSIRNKQLKIHRIVCAVDCGHIVNPALIKQQIESGVVYGLSAMKSAITLERGRVQQANFDSYTVLRIDEMAQVDVEIVQTDNPPGGIGEAAVPPVAPAVCNAIFAATRKRIRRLPIGMQDLA